MRHMFRTAARPATMEAHTRRSTSMLSNAGDRAVSPTTIPSKFHVYDAGTDKHSPLYKFEQVGMVGAARLRRTAVLVGCTHAIAAVVHPRRGGVQDLKEEHVLWTKKVFPSILPTDRSDAIVRGAIALCLLR